jgi:hypothetical protein
VGTQVFEHQAHSQTHPTYGTWLRKRWRGHESGPHSSVQRSFVDSVNGLGWCQNRPKTTHPQNRMISANVWLKWTWGDGKEEQSHCRCILQETSILMGWPVAVE